MKKLLSVVLAAVMTVSVFAFSVVPAMAETVKSPTASTATRKEPTLQVNGVPTTTDIVYSPDKENMSSVTFTYVGEGTLIGWEENLNDLGLAEGTDYTLSFNEDGSLTITFIGDKSNDAWDNGEVIVNALVDFGEGETTAVTAKTDDSSKAPATGMSASVVAGSVAVACAGIAVLAATKKKDAE
ncbi:MAG: hypothetical protein ACI4RF_04365 [Eubacterium sp.]